MTDRERDGLRGPVKSVLTRHSYSSSADGQQPQAPSFLTTYDFQGRYQETLVHNPDGSVGRRSFVYGEWGTRTEAVYQSGEGVVLSHTRHTQDPQGQVVEQAHRDGEGRWTPMPTRVRRVSRGSVEELPQVGTYSYSVDGIVGVSVQGVRRVRTYGDPERSWRVSFEGEDGGVIANVLLGRDEAGRVTSVSQHARRLMTCGEGACEVAPRELTERKMNQRRRAGMTMSIWFRVILHLMTLWPYVRRLEMRKAWSCIRYGLPGMEIAIVYDASGRKAVQCELAWGRLVSRNVYSYDPYGELAEIFHYEPEGALRARAEYQRERDGHGNWTRETVVSDRSTACSEGACAVAASPVTERVLTYY